MIAVESEKKILTKYADTLLTILNILLQKSLNLNYFKLQEDVLNAISMLSAVIGNEFAKYYNLFMPALKTILNSVPSETHQQINLRTLCIECMGFMASAVKENPTIFLDDLENIMAILVNLQTSGKLTEDDPQHSAIMNVYIHSH